MIGIKPSNGFCLSQSLSDKSENIHRSISNILGITEFYFPAFRLSIAGNYCIDGTYFVI